MPKPPRRVGLRSASSQLSLSDAGQDDDLADDFEEGAELPVPKPDDPARVAVALMLARALMASGTTYDDAGRDGAVTVVVVVGALTSALLERRVLDGPDAEAIVMAHEPCGGPRS